MFLAQTQIADSIQQHYCSVIAQNHFEFSKQSSSQQARKQRKRSRKWTQPRMTSKTSPSSFKTSSKKCRAGTKQFTSSIIFDFKFKEKYFFGIFCLSKLITFVKLLRQIRKMWNYFFKKRTQVSAYVGRDHWPNRRYGHANRRSWKVL